MSPTYVLDRAAAADLRDIARYTNQQWGAAQTRTYAASLHNGIKALAKGQGPYKELAEIHADLRMAHCEHHYFFAGTQKRRCGGAGNLA